MEDGTERKEEPGDGEECCETLSSGHELAAATVPCPRPRQPRFEWAVLIRSNELLKEKKGEEEEMKGGHVGVFLEGVGEESWYGLDQDTLHTHRKLSKNNPKHTLKSHNE